MSEREFSLRAAIYDVAQQLVDSFDLKVGASVIVGLDEDTPLVKIEVEDVHGDGASGALSIQVIKDPNSKVQYAGSTKFGSMDDVLKALKARRGPKGLDLGSSNKDGGG